MAKRKRRIGDIEEDVIIGGLLLGGAYFFVVKPLMNAFGVDPADSNTVNQQANTGSDNNPFDPAFQPFIDFYTANQPDISLPEYCKAIQKMYLYHDPEPLIEGTSAYNTAMWGENLHYALNWWNLTPDTDAVKAIFNQVTSQVEVAALSAYMAYNYQKDLLHYIHFGGNLLAWIPNGLTEAETAQIVNRVNSLPVQ